MEFDKKYVRYIYNTVLFKGRKTGYVGDTEVSHAYPVLSFRKSVGAYKIVLYLFAPRVDDRRVVSGIIYAIKHGLQWKDASDEYGPHKMLTVALQVD